MAIEDDPLMEEIDAEEAMINSLENDFFNLFSAFAPIGWRYETLDAGLTDESEPFINIVITRESEPHEN